MEPSDDDARSPITGEHPAVIFKAAPAGARQRATAKVLLPIAIMLATGVFGPPVWQLARNVSKSGAEMDCRARITAASDFWQNKVNADLAEGLSLVLRRQSTDELAVRLDADRAKKDQIDAISAGRVSTCKVDHGYSLPADLTP